MSASEVWLFARRPAAVDDDDTRRLGRWLSEMLGLRVRLVLTFDAQTIDLPTGAKVAFAGDEAFLRSTPAGGLRLGPAAADICDLAHLTLQRKHQRDSTTAALDDAIADIGRLLDRQWPDLARLPRVPAPHRCALVLTHDVDSVDRWTSQHVRHLAHHVPERLALEGPRALLRLPWAAVRRVWEHPAIDARLEACVEAERRDGGSATYLFFSPETRYRTAFDGWYTPTTRCGREDVASLWRRMDRDGFDVGLHLSIGAHGSNDAIGVEWTALRAAVPGAVSCRNHYLKVVPGVTAAALVAAGIGVDLNSVATGYPFGTGAPFRYQDSDTYVLPTVIEDGELPVDDDRPAEGDRVWATWERVLAQALRFESVATVLVHPGKALAPVMVERLMAWGRAHGAWVTSAARFIDHWRVRANAIGCGAG